MEEAQALSREVSVPLGQSGDLLTPHRPPGHRTSGPMGTAEQWCFHK